MPYPTDTLKIVFGGNIGTDIWRTGFDSEVTITGGSWNIGDMTSVVASVETDVAAFWAGDLKTFNTSAVNYNFLRGYFYPAGSTSATMINDATVVADAGSGSTNVHPFRTCLVATKLTAFAGRRNKGRMYLPFTSGALTAATGQTNQAGIVALLADVDALFTAVNAHDWSGFDVTDHSIVVTSPTRSTDPHPVTAVRMDSLPDTQRRRTNKQLATFVETDVV